MIDYIITQSGKTLSSEAAIKISKYDNKVSRFVFNLDGTIPGRVYGAFLNPVTKEWFYLPVTNDDHAIIIGTDISLYPGKWSMMLVGVDSSYDLDDTEDIDETLVTWISTEFKRIVVLDHFITDDAIAISHPQIEKALDDLKVMHDNVVELSMETAEDARDCRDYKEECIAIKEECEAIRDEIQEMKDSLQALYNQFSAALRAEYNTYRDSIRNGG